MVLLISGNDKYVSNHKLRVLKKYTRWNLDR